MQNKEVYKKLCEDVQLPIYLHADWLDVVTKDIGGWNVVFSYKNKEIQGFWVYVHKKQLFWEKITMPPYTPYMGPRLFYPDNLSEYEKISFENKAIQHLISQLPKFAEIKFKWEKSYNNWFPFSWNKFSQQTSYTYLIKDCSDLNAVFRKFKSSTQRQVRKGEKNLKVQQGKTPESVIRLFKESMTNKSNFKVDELLLEQLHIIANKHQQAVILEAVDVNNNIIAAIYLLIDSQEMLYLYGGYKKENSNSGAMHFLFWEAIQIAHKKGLEFNFEGSMIPGVERFFRSFGGELTPVFTIERKKFPYNWINR